MPFWDKSIDLVVLTHPHSDHAGGLVEVLKRYKVDGVLFTGAVYDDPFYDEFLNEIVCHTCIYRINNLQGDF